MSKHKANCSSIVLIWYQLVREGYMCCQYVAYRGVSCLREVRVGSDARLRGRGLGATERGEPGVGPGGDRGAAHEYLPAELSDCAPAPSSMPYLTIHGWNGCMFYISEKIIVFVLFSHILHSMLLNRIHFKNTSDNLDLCGKMPKLHSMSAKSHWRKPLIPWNLIEVPTAVVLCLSTQ